MIKPPNMEIEKTYQLYMADIAKLDLLKTSRILGLKKRKEHYIIPFFEKEFTLKPDGFFTESDNKPPYDICIVLSKYLLLCPQTEPVADQFVSFRDFKDSGPLTVYFTTDVENLICSSFAGKPAQLETACKKVGGTQASFDADYDLIIQFNALPKIPLVLLFNDKDDEFEAQAKILFERRAEQYLDAECLAILGTLLHKTLTM